MDQLYNHAFSEYSDEKHEYILTVFSELVLDTEKIFVMHYENQ